MAGKSEVRIHGVPTLITKLPKGTEGGKEFARLIDLLLYHDYRSKGLIFSAFNDESGDYNGLDSFAAENIRKQGTTGYQYKFFSSPFTSSQRSDIEKSLENAALTASKTKLSAWNLVTPENLTETRKAGGGDVSWFESLKLKYPNLIIDHIGHTKLIDYFIRTKHICIRYYPSLVDDGSLLQKSLVETRARYDENVLQSRGRIEFIGMSVYKEEATKGVPIEHIYIPLTAVAENVDDSDDDAPRRNPLRFLTPGSKTVILGDPGSGKSTLLSFLALAGISAEIQSKYGAKNDQRLPIVVTLRRYADELKINKNLSLIDFIVGSVAADYSLPTFDSNFLEYYLENGLTILLFDGLDELPTSSMKKLVKDRIASFNISFPSNTSVVTSRIVGYEATARLPETKYAHYKLAKLRLSEIEAFIKDWYRVRVDNETERTANIQDLVRIVSHPENQAIRDLARNPLLLTIVALVHRIDAVLPDERVVLYQKCTETLLNTWHKWKFRDEEDRVKGRIERRNRHRIESIAYWMQCRSSASTRVRSVAPYGEIHDFLSEYIEKEEAKIIQEDPAEDQAEDFLRFVKSRTGLLIEAGDEIYSFVHLTFQEYLTATYLLTKGEKDGVVAIWDKVGLNFLNARWHEVGRLLVASFKSDESQRFFVERLLQLHNDKKDFHSCLLVGGLLTDGISAAEEASETIISFLLEIAMNTEAADAIRSVASLIRSWSGKAENNDAIVKSQVAAATQRYDGDERLRHLLTASCIGEVVPNAVKTRWSGCSSDAFQRQSFEALIMNRRIMQARYKNRISVLNSLHEFWLVDSPVANTMASAGIAVSISLNAKEPGRVLFERALLTLGAQAGPFGDHFTNLIGLSYAEIDDPSPSLLVAFNNELRGNFAGIEEEKHIPKKTHELSNAISLIITGKAIGASKKGEEAGVYSIVSNRVRRNFDKVTKISRDRVSIRKSVRRNIRMPNIGTALVEDTGEGLSTSKRRYWSAFISQSSEIELFIESTVECLGLEPKAHWIEAIRVSFLPNIPKVIAEFLSPKFILQLQIRLASSFHDNDDVYLACWLMVLDVWLWAYDGHDRASDSMMNELATILGTIDLPHAKLSCLIRASAYGDKPSAEALISHSLKEEIFHDALKAARWIPADKPEPVLIRRPAKISGSITKKENKQV